MMVVVVAAAMKRHYNKKTDQALSSPPWENKNDNPNIPSTLVRNTVALQSRKNRIRMIYFRSDLLKSLCL
jgi:hypothetical protein